MLTLTCFKCGKVMEAKTEETLQNKLHLHLTKVFECRPKGAE